MKSQPFRLLFVDRFINARACHGRMDQLLPPHRSLTHKGHSLRMFGKEVRI